MTKGALKLVWKAAQCSSFAIKFPVFFIMLVLLPLPFFMDSEGDVAVSVSSPLCRFVSDQSHDRKRKRGALCKQIKLFSESRFGRKDATWESPSKIQIQVFTDTVIVATCALGKLFFSIYSFNQEWNLHSDIRGGLTGSWWAAVGWCSLKYAQAVMY